MGVVGGIGFVWGAIMLVLLGGQAFLTIRRGFIRMRRGGIVCRDEEPVKYWLFIAAQVPILSIALAFVLYGLFRLVGA
jgi:hypothetical protein